MAGSDTSDGTVVAAGAVVWRPDPAHPGEVEVCVVHRPRYDDWSLPKGKLDRGEHLLAGAVREVEEETGQRVVLDRPLPTQHYEVNGVPKRVHYWAARAELLARAGAPAEARHAYAIAIGLERDPAVRHFLQQAQAALPAG